MKIKVLASGSTGNSYIITDEVSGVSILLDAGIPVKEIQRGCGFKLSKVAGCLITHCHKDHSKAAKDLMKLGVDVYMSKGTANECGLDGHRLHIVAGAGKPFRVGPFLVKAFDVEHDAPEPLGFLVDIPEAQERLLYLTDSYYTKYRFSGLTHIMAECNYDMDVLMENLRSGVVPSVLAPRILKSHMNLDNLLDMLRVNDLSRLRQVWLIHLSDNNSDAAKMKEAVQRLTGAEVYVC